MLSQRRAIFVAFGMFSYRVDNEVELRLPEMRHAEEIFSVVRENLFYLKEWMPWATEDYSLESAQDYLRRNLQSFADNTGFGASIVINGRICGQIGYNKFDWSNKTTEIGYWLVASAQGRGVMTRCCCVLINHAFDQLNMNRVQINCATENYKSRAIPERLGFKAEGIYRQAEWLHHRFVDLAAYSMLAKDWKKMSQTR